MKKSHSIRISLALILGVALGCGGGEESSAAEEAAGALAAVGAAAPSSATASLVPRIGGQIRATATGGFAVEVLPLRDGTVQAVVVDPTGNVVSNIPEIRAEVQTESGPQSVVLRFDAEVGRYVGNVSGGAALEASTSVDVSFSKDGEQLTSNFEKVAAAPTFAAHGGTVVVAGDMSAEIVAKPNEVTAWVEAPEGAVTGSDATISVVVPVEGGGTSPVELAWNAELSAYVGRPTVTIVPGPLAFTVERRGTRHQTRVASFGVVRPPAHQGEVVVAGDYSVEVVPEDDGNLKAYVVDVAGAPAAGATVNVVVGVERRPVVLVWNADARAYVGAVEPSVNVSAAPIGVTVLHRGRRVRGGVHVAHSPRLRGWHERRGGARVEVEGPEVGLRPGRIDPGPAAAGVVVRGPGGDVRVVGPGGGVRVTGPQVRVQGPGASVMVQGPGGGVRVDAPGVRVRGGGAGATVRVPAPPSPPPTPMVNVRVGGGGGASAGGGGAMGGASVMAGASVMFGR